MKTINLLLYFSSYAIAKDSLRTKVNNVKQSVKASVESTIADVEKSVESAVLKNIEEVENVVTDVQKNVENMDGVFAELEKSIDENKDIIVEHAAKELNTTWKTVDLKFQRLLELSQNLRIEGECVLSRDMDNCTAESDCMWCNCDVVYTEFSACAPQRVAQELESVCMCDSSEAFEGTEEPTSEETSEATDDEKSEVLEGTEEPTSEETSEATDDEKSEAADDDDETEEPTSEPTAEDTTEATSEETSLVSSSNKTKIFAEVDESVGSWHDDKCTTNSLQVCAQSGCSICECDILGNDVAFCVEAGFAVELPEACDCSDAVRIKHLLTKNLDSLVQK